MALTASTMLALGTHAPDFSLIDTVSGKTFRLASLRPDLATVIMFICNHCPYVKHVQSGLVQLVRDYQRKSLSFIAISSNDAQTYPEDAPDKMKQEAQRLDYPFPYLYDETQSVARACGAACTPDFFVFDAGMKCVYRGRMDDSTPGNGRPVTGADLRAALDALLAGEAVSADQKPSLGCNIKWVRPRAS